MSVVTSRRRTLLKRSGTKLPGCDGKSVALLDTTSLRAQAHARRRRGACWLARMAGVDVGAIASNSKPR